MIFCENCRRYSIGSWGCMDGCNQKTGKGHNYEGRYTVRALVPSKQNASNDCPFYKHRWWKLWVKKSNRSLQK